jgi:hypothetical protein
MVSIPLHQSRLSRKVRALPVVYGHLVIKQPYFLLLYIGETLIYIKGAFL